MNDMNEAELAQLRAALLERAAALSAHLAAEADAAGPGASAANDVEASPADNASARTLNQLVYEATEHQAAQLRAVKQALARFDNDHYGICEQCGEPIGLSRLRARPEARYCIACQTKMEKTRR
ncbi:MAG: TraR/DksA C4-type zinc finger protein [Pseudomonadota bacterium]